MIAKFDIYSFGSKAFLIEPKAYLWSLGIFSLRIMELSPSIYSLRNIFAYYIGYYPFICLYELHISETISSK